MDNQKKDLIVEKNVVEKDPHKAQKAESWERKMRIQATQCKIGIEKTASSAAAMLEHSRPSRRPSRGRI